jgi:F-type H+-transporting ATPase subunit gamma
MVAASKLKRAQEQAEASQPYAKAMAEMMARVAANVVVGPNSPKLLIGTGSDQRHLLVVVTADRGLAGGFNANLARLARNEANRLKAEGKSVKIITVGRKGRDVLRREFSANLAGDGFTGITGKTKISFADADAITQQILEMFGADEFDVCSLIYNEFRNVLTQKPKVQQLIPFGMSSPEAANDDVKEEKREALKSPYSFEPEEDVILGQLLPKNIGVQIFRALLDSSAGEQAARMTAMDNATRNAGDMINRLTLQYNRARQAYITKELIEIISGAEAV